MGKKKKKKELKKQRKLSEKLGRFRGKDILIRRCSDNISGKSPLLINNIDNGLNASYLGIIYQKYGENQKRAVCRSHRDHVLVAAPLIDTGVEYMKTYDADRIWCYMGMIHSMLLNNQLSYSVPIYKADGSTDYIGILLEQCPEKPIGYYRLAKASNVFPGLSRTMSNYIIDEVAAVRRICSFNYNFDIGSACRERSSMYKIRDIWDYDLEDIKKDPKFYKELDIRTCLLGDIETNVIGCHPCFIFMEDHMCVYSYILHEYRGLSPYFGTVVHVVTNPSAFFNYPEVKSKIFDM